MVDGGLTPPAPCASYDACPHSCYLVRSRYTSQSPKDKPDVTAFRQLSRALPGSPADRAQELQEDFVGHIRGPEWLETFQQLAVITREPSFQCASDERQAYAYIPPVIASYGFYGPADAGP